MNPEETAKEPHLRARIRGLGAKLITLAIVAVVLFFGLKGCIITVWVSPKEPTTYEIIGVDDSGEPIGITDFPKAEQILTNVLSHNCHPPIQATIRRVEIQGRQVAAVDIPERKTISTTCLHLFPCSLVRVLTGPRQPQKTVKSDSNYHDCSSPACFHMSYRSKSDGRNSSNR